MQLLYPEAAAFAVEIGRQAILGIRYRRQIEWWARKNRLTFLECEERSFSKGAFFWDCDGDACVYRILVQDRAGATRKGFLKVESSGILQTPRVDVRWKD